EVEKALNTASPATFFQSMLACGALSVVLPELANLVGKSQPARYHPEGDAWSHTLEVLNRVSAQTNLAPLRFAALMHDIGKSTTPAECLPHHHGHEERGVLLLQEVATRLRIPNNYLKLALLVTAHHGRYRHVPHMRPSSIVKLLTNLSPWQEDSLFNQFLLVCQADLAGREGEEVERGPFLQRCLERCREVTAQPFLQQGLSGAAIGEAITRQRIRLVSQVVKEFFSTTAIKVLPHKCPDHC
ncbi:MAG: HD domain-containing protein, partial [Magnetococcales bacterium]|nr:HD domain-containing protein [Magnetococcales bacterium]